MPRTTTTADSTTTTPDSTTTTPETTVETPVETPVETTVETEEVAPTLLNEAVPPRIDPGHHSRDFSA
jgi:hypothetical protein